uniref:START domain-containing protein n=1 Tax=Trieres chinensis TaxID=1514140 RepID=A0A7S2A132_TRICV|mmetsp:Transcript_36845/g.75163  ORF Transcript_36845/g.75163 Transcript_36845/m.75163 type:complete len:184 (+) Transcript_36845:2-553(+)
MSPLSFAELLMDSSRVRSYNKMSLGRADLICFQLGIDTIKGEYGNGEAKIVRNLTQPPLSKRRMEFITLMHARRLDDADAVNSGMMGGDKENGFVVVSRAIGGNKIPNKEVGNKMDDGHDESYIRSEILLGVNLIRPIPGHPQKAEVTAVTHCNSPSVPTMLAGKVGVKGAVGFVKDVRALCQ